MTNGPKPKDRTGEVKGKLTLVSFSHRDDGPKGARYWSAMCDCGNKTVIRIGSPKKSCGCAVGEWCRSGNARRSHGKRHAPEYDSWSGMKSRCLNKNNPKYYRYGGRGITICEEWINSFSQFYEDMGQKISPEHSIDRIDNDSNYCKDNCKWSTRKEQANNRHNSFKYTSK